MLDFTLKKYESLCLTILDCGYDIYSLCRYLKNKKSNRSAILRHDVDRKAENALKMAILENKLGIHSTYYFRYPHTFNPALIREICHLGHEAGYHYETLSKTKCHLEKAIDLFAFELGEFRKICPLETICMHGTPLSRHDNRDIWKTYDFRDFGIIGEAYLSFDGNAGYYTDTGRSWNSKSNIRDFITVRPRGPAAEKTDDLIKLIKDNQAADLLYITTHPERWAVNKLDWLTIYAKDLAFNLGKGILGVARR